jgi:ABC-type branched-subunit amino acid transport system substrate-binding protein
MMNHDTTEPLSRWGRSRRLWRVTTSSVVALAAAATVAACGSSSPSSTSASASGSASASASGSDSPIKIMTMGEYDIPALGLHNPQWSAAVQGQVNAVNAAGGINGRKIQVIACNLGNNPNLATACAQQAVNDKVAAVTSIIAISEEAQIYPILSKAKIPIIGGQSAATSLPFTSPTSFPLDSGTAGQFAGMCTALAQQHKKRIALVTFSTPGIEGPISYCENAIKANHGTPGPVVVIPASATDLSSYIQKATSGGTDAVALDLTNQEENALTTLHTQAPTMTVLTPDANVSNTALPHLGKKLDGVYTVSSVQPVFSDAAGAKEYVANLKSVDPSYKPDGNGERAWLAAWVFSQVAQKIKVVNASTVLAAMGKLENFPTDELTAPFTTTKPNTKFPGLPRMYNPTIVPGVIKNGVITSLSPTPIQLSALSGQG